MFTKGYSRLVILCFCVMLAGCATSRSEIKLHSPTIVAPTPSSSSTQRVVVIGNITDDRIFEQAPTDPSTPSLGFGGADNASGGVKARAIARKRNTYGKALGDVLLQPGDTVESVIRENLIAALEQAGYQVKGQGDAGPSPLVVDVHIKKFWAWFDPGFWAITLSNNIATDLVVNGAGAPMVVSTHVEEKRQVATEDAWMQIVDKGLDAYRGEVLRRMREIGDATMPVMAANSLPTPTSVKSASIPVMNTNPAVHLSTEAATVPTPVAPMPSQASHDSAVVATEATPTSMPASEIKQQAALTVPAQPASMAAAAPQDSAANAAITPLAQSLANQLGCGAVQANGATTFIAPCGTYSVLIDCDSGQCRPMHTVNVKHDE